MKNKILILLSVLFLILTLLVFYNTDIFFDSYIYDRVSYIINDNITNKIIFITNICSMSISILISLIVVLLLFKYNKKYDMKIFVFTLLIGNLVIYIIKFIVSRDRPDILQLVTESTKSFPSGHAYISTLLYGLILLIINKYSKRKYAILLTLFYMLFIVLIGFTRIYLGVHYFTDVIGGYLLGFITLIFAYPFLNKETK